MKALRSAAAALALTVLLMVAGHAEAGDGPHATAPAMTIVAGSAAPLSALADSTTAEHAGVTLSSGADSTRASGDYFDSTMTAIA